MSEYESPIVEGLNSDVGASRGTAAIGETFFASQFCGCCCNCSLPCGFYASRENGWRV